MGVASFFELAEVHGEPADNGSNGGVVEVDDAQGFAPAEDGDFTVVEVDDTVGVFDDGGGVGGEEEFVFADADNEGAAFACGDDAVGVVFGEDGNGVGADDLLEGELYGGAEVDAVGVTDVFDEVDDDFGVGVAAEGVAFAFEFETEDGVVLDDAVVYEGEGTGLRVVGVGVEVVRLAVGSPTGVGDADGAGGVFGFGEALKVGDFAFGFVEVEYAAVGDEGDARAVVAAVFETMKSFNEYWVCLSGSQITNYSTHRYFIF